MRLSVTCPDCRQPVPLDSGARTRLDLKRAHGLEVPASCPTCRREVRVHPDDVHASPGRLAAWVPVAAVALAVGLSVWLWNRGWVSTIPVIAAAGLYGAWTTEANRRASAFNAFRLGRR